MLSSLTGRSATRFFSKQTCRFNHDLSASSIARLASVLSSSSGSILLQRSAPVSESKQEPSRLQRTFATRTASAAKTPRGRPRKPRGRKGQGKPSSRKQPGKARLPKPKKIKKPKRVAPKKLSEEEKRKKKISELKRTALKKPTKLPDTVFTLISGEISRETGRLAGAAAAEKLRQITPEEHERYNHIANENKSKNNAAFTAWLHSYTPDEIRRANNARSYLRREGVKGFRSNLIDDRLPKQPIQARNFFLKDRHASGDFKGISIADAAGIITKEWRELSDAGKQEYRDRESQSRKEYIERFTAVYGREPMSAKAKKTTKTTKS